MKKLILFELRKVFSKRLALIALIGIIHLFSFHSYLFLLVSFLAINAESVFIKSTSTSNTTAVAQA